MTRKPVVVVESAPLKYLLSIPSRPEEGRPAPLLCFLHGRDEGAPRPIEQGLVLHSPLAPWAAPLAAERFVIVAPQLPAQGDIWHRYAGIVAGLARQIELSYRTDPARKYLTGFSFGGNGVLDLGLEQPEAWAALWPVDPTRVPDSDPGRPVWLSAGQLARGQAKDYARVLGLKAPGEGGDRIYSDDGKDHAGAARTAYSEERVYRWLLERSL